MAFWTDLDPFVAGLLGGLLAGAAAGWLSATLTNSRLSFEARRAERLRITDLLHPQLERHLRATRPGLELDDRLLYGLVSVSRWHRRCSLQRRVNAYQQACQQDQGRDSHGGVHYLQPQRVKDALRALQPFMRYG